MDNNIITQMYVFANMYTFTQIMKDFYLLGRGELYLAFVDLAHSFMRLPPTTTTQHGTCKV